MSEAQAAPKLRKWPFYLADIVLSAIAAYVLTRSGLLQGSTGAAIILGCLVAAGWGAWLSITPWLVEFRTKSSFAENTNLKSTLDQIQNVEKVADLIRQANSQWQGVQDASGRTVTAAREIADKMKVETDEFMKFIENARDQERAGLRLEVDKLRKMEGDWIKVTIQMLDHTFALCRAAERSGQEQLVKQLAQFQNACRDVARRMGLVPFVPAIGEKFDARGHQLPNASSVVDENATISEVLATGFTYQSQLLRRSLVLLNEPRVTEPEPIKPALQEPNSPEQPIAPAQPEDGGEIAEGPGIIETELPPAELTEESSPAEPEPPKRSRAAQEPSAQNELPLV